MICPKRWRYQYMGESITVAPLAGRQSDVDKCKRREDVGMLWWTSCSGLRVLEDDKIPSKKLWEVKASTDMNGREVPLGGHIEHCSCIEDRRLVDCQHVCAEISHDSDDKILSQINKFQRMLVAGWMRDIPQEALDQLQDEREVFSQLFLQRARLRRWVSEGQEWAEDVWTLVAAGIEDLYTKVLEPYIRKTPALRDAFAMMMIARSWWCILTPHCQPPTHPTKHNLHLDIFSNIRFSPKLCRWAFDRKTWRDSGGLCSKIICCILRYWTNSLTINEKICKPGWRPLQASCAWDLCRNAWRPQLHHYAIVRQKGKTTGCKCKLIHEDGTVSSMDNRKTRCEGTWKRSIFYRSRPLEESWHRERRSHCYTVTSSWWTHGSRRNSFVIS